MGILKYKDRMKNPLGIAVIILTLLVLGGGAYQFTQVRSYQQKIENQYNRAFHEIVEAVRDIETSLQKGMLVSNARQVVTLSSEINRNAQAARGFMGELPLSDTQLDKLSTFLAQVGDYSYVMSMKVVENNTLTDEEYKQLASLLEYAKNLNSNLKDMQDDLYAGRLSIGKIVNTSNREMTNVGAKMTEVEKQFSEYPTLVYDGPFSSHIENMAYSSLSKQPEVTLDEAKQKVKEFLGDKAGIVENTGEKIGTVAVYAFVAYPDPSDKSHSISVDVTKNGGHALWTLDSRQSSGTNVSVDDAKKAAKAYLEMHGYVSMKDSYFESRDNIATINFAYTQNKVVMYPDLIKVKVALDNAEILGIELQGYMLNHKQRSLPTPSISPEQAREKVNNRLAVSNVSLCVIPSESMTDLYCYEVKGKSGDRNFLVYVNAQSGREEKIIMLIESEEGILSM